MPAKSGPVDHQGVLEVPTRGGSSVFVVAMAAAAAAVGLAPGSVRHLLIQGRHYLGLCHADDM